MINIKDLLDITKLGNTMLLVSSAEAYTKFQDGVNTGEIAGYKYHLVLSEYNWDKISIKIESPQPLIDFEGENGGTPIKVKLEELQANAYVQNNRVALSFKAKSIKKVN
ncbi:hypothetical protein ACH0BF_09790 [Pseudobacillus sp. 179-B 2D1 NHS]|uniref:hypothetical protein n=1 Tax=Pseudobacillus sp. 179-B 2D1 NHS TaxID=3374292 RepID=UPI00387986DF